MKHVRRVTLCLLCCFTLGLQIRASEKPAVKTSHDCSNAGEQKAIEQIAQEWKEGYNSRNATQVGSLYDANAYYLTQHFATGIVHGRADIQAYVQRGIDAGYHIDSIAILQTTCSGNFAYTVGRYDATNAGQKVFGVNLVVLRKTGGRWLIVAHEAAVPDATTAIQELPNAPRH